MITALTDAILFTGEAFVEGHALLIRDGKILDIVGNRKIPADAKVASHGGKILAPGFIDLQVNGGGNVLFNNTPTEEACLAIAAAHRRYGTARLLPTIISDTPEITRQAIAAARAARRKDKSILGIHIEGPHLGAVARGVHKEDYLRPLTGEDLRLYRREGDEIMLITVAPECVPPAQIKQLCAQGAIVMLGHTNAAPEQIHAALKAGAKGFTHLFNGMDFNRGADGIKGPAKTALEDRDSWCSIIGDGHHVSAEMFRLALKSKPGRIFLVSDAMAPSATKESPPPRREGQGGGREAWSGDSSSRSSVSASPPLPQPLPQGEGSLSAPPAKSFELYGETIFIKDGRLVSSEGKLAGALATLGEAVQNCIKKFGIEPDEALRMASFYPAQFLGLDQSLGKLLPGFGADVAAMDIEFNVYES